MMINQPSPFGPLPSGMTAGVTTTPSTTTESTEEGGGKKKGKGGGRPAWAGGPNSATALPPGLQKKADAGGALPPGNPWSTLFAEVTEEETTDDTPPLPSGLPLDIPMDPVTGLPVLPSESGSLFSPVDREALGLLPLPEGPSAANEFSFLPFYLA